MDQNGPRVRVWKIVRCPATDSIRYIIGWSAGGQVTLLSGNPGQSGDRTEHAQDRGDPHTTRMFRPRVILVENVVEAMDRIAPSLSSEHHDHHRRQWVEVENRIATVMNNSTRSVSAIR